MQQDPQKTSQQPDDQELEQNYRQYTQAPQPGGRAKRGPAVHPGGETEPQGVVPPYEGRKKQAETVDASRPSQAGNEDVKGSGGIRQSTESPRTTDNDGSGTNASAEEIKDRIDQTATDVEHGSSEGEPDPVTHENVDATRDEAQGRPRGGTPGR